MIEEALKAQCLECGVHEPLSAGCDGQLPHGWRRRIIIGRGKSLLDDRDSVNKYKIGPFCQACAKKLEFIQ